MLTYYHMKISILLQQFDQTIFEGIIAQFDWEYLIKKYNFILYIQM